MPPFLQKKRNIINVLRPLPDHIRFFRLHGWPCTELPDGLIGLTAIIPFIDINRIAAQAVHFILNIALQAVHCCQYANDAEYTKCNTGKAQRRTQLVHP